MKLDIATLEAFLESEKNIRRKLPPSSTTNCSILKEHVAKMSDHDAAELCRWVCALSDAARVLRSLEFKIPD